MTPFALLPPEQSLVAPPWKVSRWFGTPHTLESLKGKVVVLHAFQMLCPGCVIHGVPQATSIHSHFSQEDVAVIGLHSVFEHHDAMTDVSLAAFLHEFRVPFPVAIDAHHGSQRIPLTMASYGLQGTPSLVLIDRDGLMRAKVFGRPSDMAVASAVATLVGSVRQPQGDQQRTPAPGCDDNGCPIER